MARCVRFVTARRDADSHELLGVIHAAHELKDRAGLSATARQELATHLEWFDTHLPKPERFVMSKSKGFYRRRPVAISWFKARAAECISHAEELARILTATDTAVERLETEHPGYVVYEDEFQIVAVPFRDR